MIMLCHQWRMGITLDREPRRKVSGKDIPPTYFGRLGEPTPLQPTTNKSDRTRCSFGSSTSMIIHDKQGPIH